MKSRHLIILCMLVGAGLSGCNHPGKTTGSPASGTATTTTSEAAKPDSATGTAEPGFVELTEAQFQTAGIKLGAIESRTLSNLVRASGILNAPPQQQVSVSTPYGGILKTASLLPGTAVRRGQVLAVLENPEFIRLQQEYLETISQLTFQQQEYDRQRELSRENVGALKTFQQATAQLGTLRARTEGLRQQVTLLGVPMAALNTGRITRTAAIRAPISGIVTAANVNRGRYVSANDVLFEITNTANLLAELTVFERDVAVVRVGQRVRISVVGETTERLGRITLINRETNADRTVKVYASINSQPGRATGSLARPGTFLKAAIETGTASAEPALPEAAIVQAGSQPQIFVFDSKTTHDGIPHYRFRVVPVRAGLIENGYRAITLPPNLKPGNRIVIAGAYDLLSAMNNVEEEE